MSGSRSPATYSSRSTTELKTASYSTPVRSIIGMESTSSMYPGGDSSQRGSRRWRMLSVSSPLSPQAAFWKPNQMGVSRYKDQYSNLTANHIRTPPRRKYLLWAVLILNRYRIRRLDNRGGPALTLKAAMAFGKE